MNTIKHAKQEFEILGWPGECEIQKAVCDHVIKLLETFSDEGHSGLSANYTLGLFDKLAKFDPISPLTGEDGEWSDISDISGCYQLQNNRDSSVFKNKDGAYWLYGKVFRDKSGCTYTSSDSSVPIEFPWVKPESEIIDVDE